MSEPPLTLQTVEKPAESRASFGIYSRDQEPRVPFLIQILALNRNNHAKSHDDGFVFQKADRMCVMLEDGAVRGKIEYRTWSEDGLTLICEIFFICAPGFGDRLLRDFEERMRVSNVTEIRLTYDMIPCEPSISMRRMNFYAKHGYRVVHATFKLYCREYNGVHFNMVKRLDGKKIEYEEDRPGLLVGAFVEISDDAFVDEEDDDDHDDDDDDDDEEDEDDEDEGEEDEETDGERSENLKKRKIE
jgi:hypothetical protein